LSDLFANLSIENLTSTSWLMLVGAVWIASFVGSPHCLGMCGPIATAVARDWRDNLSYNLGRGLAYAALGAVVGAAGGWIVSSAWPWARAVATGLMVILVLAVSWRILRDDPWHFPMPAWFLGWQRRISRWVLRAEDLSPHTKSFAAGILTVGLPCGWLYTFAALAAAAGGAGRGAAVLAAFWMGSLPVMTAGPLVAGHFVNGLRHRSPALVAALVASSALSVIWMRWAAAALHHCH